ncbi:unnamed protein product [Cunninghamella blakesleeana]
MGRRKQYMDEGGNSSGEEEGRISFDITDRDYDDEMMGFAGFQQHWKKKQKRFEEDMGDDSEEEEEGRMSFSTASAMFTQATSFLPAKKDTKERVKKDPKEKIKNSPSRSASASPGPGFADFSKHTTGYGLKMLEKMGWKAGKGLGSSGEGIINPVETKQRPKGMGMGFRGFDERTDQAKKESRYQSSSDEDGKEDEMDDDKKMKPRQAWKKTHGEEDEDEDDHDIQQQILHERNLKYGKKRKSKKVKYQTASDILAKAQQILEKQPQKVIDMTGPDIREIALSDIKRTDSPTLMETTTRLPELRHNLRLIVDLSRGELENLSREKQTTMYRWKAMEEELGMIENRYQIDDEKLKKIQEAKNIGLQLQKIGRDALANGMYESATITTLFGEQFELLKDKYMDQVIQLGLDAMVVAVWSPIMKYKCAYWDVLANPMLGLDDVKKWRPLLRCNDDNEKKNKKAKRLQQQQQITLIATPYETMMNTIWLSKVRSAVNNSWQVRDPDSLIQLLEAWQDVLPRFIFENIVYQLILPKLTKAVSDWDPRNDVEMVHTWIHPWFPVLRAWRLADICTTIRHKLSVIMRQWHPSDESALEVIGKWKGVWSTQQMDSFLQKNIIPKLTHVLRHDFIVNPRDQQLDPLAWCLVWHGIISDHVFGQLLENEFFPQWLNALYKWLTLDPKNISYDEVRDWYLWWKQVFDSFGVLNEPIVLKCTRKALDMMSAASSGEHIEKPL